MLVFALTSPIKADTLFEQRRFESFTLAGAVTIDTIVLDIAFNSVDTTPPAGSDTFTYAFYGNAAGALGTQLAVGTASSLTPVFTALTAAVAW